MLNALLTHCHGIHCATLCGVNWSNPKIWTWRKVHVEVSEERGHTEQNDAVLHTPDENTSNKWASLLWETKTFWSQCSAYCLSPLKRILWREEDSDRNRISFYLFYIRRSGWGYFPFSVWPMIELAWNCQYNTQLIFRFLQSVFDVFNV